MGVYLFLMKTYSYILTTLRMRTGQKMGEKVASVQRKTLNRPSEKPGELLLKTTLIDYKKV